MIDLTRRDFLRASSAIAAALGLHSTGLMGLQKAFGLESGADGLPVVWLQGQCCSGCSVSLLNSISIATAETFFTETVDAKFHPTIMAGAAEVAQAAAEAAYDAGGYVLVVEGSIPTADGGAYCHLWPGMTALQGVKHFASRADAIVAVGACGCYGGVCGGEPNPTGARGMGTYFAGKKVVNLPGCPVHPDWVVGTVAWIIENGTLPALDGFGRPTMYFGNRVHRGQCPHYQDFRSNNFAQYPGDDGCLLNLGCRGQETMADCTYRKWNAGAEGQMGVNWCAQAGAPCYGCTQPGFPDQTAPFINIPQAAVVNSIVEQTVEDPAPRTIATVLEELVAEYPEMQGQSVRAKLRLLRDLRRLSK